MRTTLKIIRAELRNLFYSPVAWFVSTIFMILCGLGYFGVLKGLAVSQATYRNSPRWSWHSSLTNIIYLGSSGSIFSMVMSYLYLFIPLLTMGVLSREVSNGSIKLLYSSPVKTRHIVLGKYLSLMVYNMLLLAIVGIFMILGCFTIQSIDYGLLLAALLGFYLMVCTYSAIGLWMSSLTSYQIISGIGTLMILYLLNIIGSLWQQIDFVRDLTYFFTIGGRTVKMLKGLITTKDVFYFLLIIGMFLGFTLLKLKSGRESKRWYVTAGKYLGIIIVVVALGYITSRPKLVGYWDTTAEQVNTIDPKVQKIVKGFGDEPLEVTYYSNLLGLNGALGFPRQRNSYLNLWEPYFRFKPDITFKYEYYYDAKPGDRIFKQFPGKTKAEIAKVMAKVYNVKLPMFKTPEEMKKIIDMEPEGFNSVMQLKYKDRTTFLRLYQFHPFPDQPQVAAAMARVREFRMPKILFVTGHLERDISVRGERGFSTHTSDKLISLALINNGFDVDSISLETQDIPSGSSNIAALVLADPKIALSAVARQKIDAFIAKGGNMLILGEPGKEDLLNPILQPLGVQLTKGTLIKVTKDYTPDLVPSYLTWNATGLAESISMQLFKRDYPDSLKVRYESAAPIECIENARGFIKKPLAMTEPGKAWLKKGILVKDSTPPILNPKEGDFKLASFLTTVALTRKINNKEQRIIVAGDADFISNRFVQSLAFTVDLYSWLDYNAYPVYGRLPAPKDDVLLIFPGTVEILKWVFLWLLPASVALLGIVILVRRKRK